MTGVVQNPTTDFFSDITTITDEPTHRGCRNLINVNAENLVNTWTETKRSDKLEDDDFQLNRILMDLFIQFNTPVPCPLGLRGCLAKPETFCVQNESPSVRIGSTS